MGGGELGRVFQPPRALICHVGGSWYLAKRCKETGLPSVGAPALHQHPWTLQGLPVILGIPALVRGWDVFSLGLVT